VKYAFIQSHQQHHAAQRLCEILGVSTSGYYDWLNRKASQREQANIALLHKIRAIHRKSLERYGSPRIHKTLQQQGVHVAKGRVERLMRINDIKARRSRRHRRVYEHREPVSVASNILNRAFTATQPNRKWVSDITFVPTRQGYLYLAIVLDLYSRAIVGWSMSARINGQLVLDALEMAIEQRGMPRNVLVHSDQGSQYTAGLYQQMLAKYSMQCSMSRKGNCHDNAVAESFFHTLKEELVTDADYKTRSEARQSIFKYIELFYNRSRLHSTIDYQAPLVYEKMQEVA
jgi:putative transposase